MRPKSEQRGVVTIDTCLYIYWKIAHNWFMTSFFAKIDSCFSRHLILSIRNYHLIGFDSFHKRNSFILNDIVTALCVCWCFFISDNRVSFTICYLTFRMRLNGDVVYEEILLREWQKNTVPPNTCIMYMYSVYNNKLHKRIFSRI